MKAPDYRRHQSPKGWCQKTLHREMRCGCRLLVLQSTNNSPLMAFIKLGKVTFSFTQLESCAEWQKVELLKSMQMHGRFYWDLDRPAGDKKSINGMAMQLWSGETESLIIAAQVQAVNTRYHRKNRSRIHNKAEEHVSCTTPTHSKVTSHGHCTNSKHLLANYKDFEREISRMGNAKMTEVPVIVRTLGTLKKHYDRNRQLHPRHPSLREVQKIAFLCTVYILQKVLGWIVLIWLLRSELKKQIFTP